MHPMRAVRRPEIPLLACVAGAPIVAVMAILTTLLTSPILTVPLRRQENN
ncbi:MAG: hypothetical protein HYU78_05080 [Rhodocyclales bacterium]|nr:hypothetical protein [Rhodocyclales bacterium]